MAEVGMEERRGRNRVTVATQTDLSFSGQSEMTEHGMGEGRRTNKVTVGTQTNPSFSSSAELLPGIPNQITLDEICPRLHWKEFHVLSSVSSSWLEAIRSHQVYNARVGAKSVETFVVHMHSWNNTRAMALYSTTDKRCFELPPIPHLDNRVPRSCQCISLDGMLYVLEESTAELFVLDIAGQRQWKQCARMEEPRQQFGWGVLDGKIYVFGGTNDIRPARKSEVYDPKGNEWSPIMSMPSWRFNHKVAAIGEELFAYGGNFYRPHFFDDNGIHAGFHIIPAALSLDVYHPKKNEWRVVESFGKDEWQRFFTAKGKLYEMSTIGIHVYDMEQNSWTTRHKDFVAVLPNAILAVNDELYIQVPLESPTGYGSMSQVLCSRGFDSEDNAIVWQKTCCKRWECNCWKCKSSSDSEESTDSASLSTSDSSDSDSADSGTRHTSDSSYSFSDSADSGASLTSDSSYSFSDSADSAMMCTSDSAIKCTILL